MTSLPKSRKKRLLKRSDEPSVHSSQNEHVAYVGIGSNLGDKVGHCQRAIAEILKVNRHRLLGQSSLYKTQPIGYTSQDWFVNGVIKIGTDLEPTDLLRMLKGVERRLGRVETFRWGPRLIDLDILFFDEKKVETEELKIPHPLAHERGFVLVPLAEIDPDLIHPVFKKTVQELLEGLGQDQGVEKLRTPREESI